MCGGKSESKASQWCGPEAVGEEGYRMRAVHFPGGSVGKDLPAVQETCVRSLGQEDPLEKEMAAHSSILAWRIPWTEESVELQFTGSQRVGHN